MSWIATTWAPGASLETLQKVPKRHVSLSRKLASELFDTCPAHVKQRIEAYNRQLMPLNRLNGPQVLWIVIDAFEHDDQAARNKSIVDLHKLKWFGDSLPQRHKFLNVYIELTTTMKGSYMTEEALADLLHGLMKESTELKWE